MKLEATSKSATDQARLDAPDGFHRRFHERVQELLSDAVVLDLDDGRRRWDDPRYVNLADRADWLGCETPLPFKANSVDFIYSADVMQQVRNPLWLGAEVARILKPGGRALIGAPFMSPTRPGAAHFFNLTPYGIQRAFIGLAKLDCWWEGAFSELAHSLISTAGLEGTSDPADVKEFIALATKLDSHLDDAGLMYIATSVWLEGVKN